MPKGYEADNLWDRQKEEGEKAYEAFTIYRDMGPERSITKVSQQLHKNRALIGRWSRKFDWIERCLAYDNNLQKEAHAEAVKKARKMAARHIGIALKMQAEAVEALEKTDPENIKPKDIIAFIREGTKLERENRQDILLTTDLDLEKAESSTSLSDAILEAWKKRMQQDESKD